MSTLLMVNPALTSQALMMMFVIVVLLINQSRGGF